MSLGALGRSTVFTHRATSLTMFLRKTYRSTCLRNGLAMCVVAAAGCGSEPPAAVQAEQVVGVSAALVSSSMKLSWDEMGYRAPGHETVADGPSAIALSGGELYILDQRNARIVRVDAKGSSPVVSVEPDAELLAIGPGGEFATHSFLTSTVHVRARDGLARGSVRVPRAIRATERISFASTGQLVAHSAHQERFVLGTPAAPQLDEQVLLSKREGMLEASGASGAKAGLQVRLNARKQATLERVGESPSTGRIQVESTMPLAERANSVRLMGKSNGVACVLVERVQEEARVRVDRELSCHNVQTAAVVLRETLPKGTYVPRQDVAVADGRVAWMVPTPEGLVIQVRDLQGGAR